MHLDPRTALIVVDVQNDFADPAGSLSVEGATRVIPIVNAAIAEIRDAHGLVVYTQDWHPETTPHFEKDGGIWPVHCVADTWGAELHPDLEPPEPDTEECVIRKGTNGEDGYSAFTVRDPETGATSPTDLETILRARGTGRVIVCGLATDYCVRATALDAVALGFTTEVLPEAIAAVDLTPGDGARALDEMTTAGVFAVALAEP
jgi:nicotinamidase/pyrazinamidase